MKMIEKLITHLAITLLFKKMAVEWVVRSILLSLSDVRAPKLAFQVLYVLDKTVKLRKREQVKREERFPKGKDLEVTMKNCCFSISIREPP
jgi:hypothetical protein